MKLTKSNARDSRNPIRIHTCKIALSNRELAVLNRLSSEVGIPKSNLIRSMVINDSSCMLVNIPRTLDTLDIIGQEIKGCMETIKSAIEGKCIQDSQEVNKTIDTNFNSYNALADYVALQRKLEQTLRTLIRLIRRNN